ncbi:MAG: metal ABC transporter substrate-binding protein [Methylobacterium mesophilicum]|nr:metal ABC transporter substrate-binding protein [Methylobacterium mesophilicum]
MLKRLFRAALAGIVILIPLTAFAQDRLAVVASFSVIADFAKNVGGDRVSVTTLVGPDGDAHAYEPKPADAKAMARARVILVNGLHFEGFLQRLVDTSGTRAPVVELTQGIEPIGIEAEPARENDRSHAHDHGEADPHAFQSVANARIYVRNIADAFCAADKNGCSAYEANAVAYTAKLDALEKEIKDGVASIPEAKRTIITSHDAFGYFEHAYRIAFRAPEGLSTEADPSAADVARLIEDVRREKASAIFVENITNPRLIEQIASETGLKVGGALYSDALSGPDGPASNYIDMMRHNIATIRGAVSGS